MKRDTQGWYKTTSTHGEAVRAFVPAPLPPVPPIDWHSGLRGHFDEALVALGRIDSVAMLLPDVSTFLYSFIRKEAVLSSMIEGTQSSLSDLLLFELQEQPGVPLEDVREVSNYVAALDTGSNGFATGSPYRCALFAKFTKYCLLEGEAATSCPVNSGAARTGSAAPVQATPCLYRRRLNKSWNA